MVRANIYSPYKAAQMANFKYARNITEHYEHYYYINKHYNETQNDYNNIILIILLYIILINITERL